MNYAIIVFISVLAFSIGFWYTHGRHYYTGPLAQSSGRYEMAGRVNV